MNCEFIKFIRLKKLLFSLINGILRRSLLNGVALSIEHKEILKNLHPSPNTIVDIGANRGQFTLLSRYLFPNAHVISIEPLRGPANTFRKLFKFDQNVILHEGAVGPEAKNVSMHVSARDDSSSLLPIGEKQTNVFPGTEELSLEEISVAPLNHYVQSDDLVSPALLKIDVQGFELEVLKGCGDFLEKFDYIYVECSFVELYKEQALADEVIQYLIYHSFKLNGIYNTFYDKKGIAVQGDFLFSKDQVN